MRRPFFLIALLFTACGNGERSEPNTSRTGAFGVQELRFHVVADVRSTTEGHAYVMLTDGANELFVGEGDELVVTRDGQRQHAVPNSTTSFAFHPLLDERVEASFMRGGRVVSSFPLWRGPVPDITTPQEITIGTTVEIDISPRPPPGAEVWLQLRSCLGTASAHVETLPWRLDTSAGLEKTPESSEDCCVGLSPARRCPAGLVSVVDASTHPFENGPFDRASVVRTHHELTTQTYVRF